MSKFTEKHKIQPHCRILIRQKVKQLLKTNVDINERFMFCSQPHPRFKEYLPCLFIYMPEEISKHQDSSPRVYTNELQLFTEVQIQTNSSIDEFVDEQGSIVNSFEDDWLDSRAYEIERALGTDRTMGLNGVVSDIELMRTQPININYDGEIDVSALRMTWKITWLQELSEHYTLDEFKNFGVEYKVKENDEYTGAEAEDDVTIRI